MFEKGYLQMAKVTFDAFVEGALMGTTGVFALKTAEPHSKKDENDNWQTVARTFRTVKVSRESGIDLSGFAKGDKVSVVGSEKTEVREWQGKKLYDLVVWAESVAPVQSSRGVEPVVAADDSWGGQADYDEPAPF